MRKRIRSKTMRKRENRRRRRRRHASKVYKPVPISPRLVPEPETSDCPVYRQLVNLGFYLKREKVDDCLEELGGSLNVSKKVEICFQKFLFSDLKSCGSGILHLFGIELGIEEDLETTLHGPFIFQVDEIINIRCPPKHRYQQAPPGPGIESRCLQLTLTDGVREVFGMEMEPIEALQPCANPRGLKVEISFIITRDGRLMLVPQNTRVLGGGLADDLSGSMLSQYLAPNLWNREVKAVGLLVSKHRYLLSMLEREVKSQALTRKSKSDDLLTEGCNETSELVVCFGEMLIGSMPIAPLPGFKETPSGAPANVAVGISKLGGSSAFISKVGADEFGYMLADILKQNNVDTSGMRFDSNARTSSAFFTIRADGKREFSFFRNPSADMLLDETELDCNLIKKAKIFHYGSMSLIDDPCKYVHLAALRIAKDSDCILSYDPNLRLALWPTAWDARSGIMSIWDLADIIKISENEITFLTCGGDPYDDDVVLDKLFHPNLKLLIVTEGSGGCRYYTKDFKGKVRGANVEPFDTTGAGDAFVSGILYKIASDPSIFEDEERLQKALYFANVCAAITMMKWGAIPALPTKDAVLHFDANRNIVQL